MSESYVENFVQDYPPTDVSFPVSYHGKPITDANLILEGGGMRGIFTAGVLDYFMDHGLFCKNVIGVSAGVVAATNYVAGLIGRTAYINIKYCPDPRYISVQSALQSGNAFNRDTAYRLIPDQIDPFPYEAFNQSPMSMTLVCSNLETGEADYRRIDDLRKGLPYEIASASLPGVSEIVEVDGKKLLDGGTCDSIPIFYSLLTGAPKHIVIRTRPRDYVRKPNALMPVLAMIYRDYPFYVERMRNRHFEYNRTARALERMHETGECFVVWPEEDIAISNLEHDQNKVFYHYEQGVRVAAEIYDDLCRYLDAPENPQPPEAF